MRRDEEKGRHSAAIQQTSKQSQRHPKTGEGQDMIGLRGGFGHDGLGNVPSWADERQIQPYVLRPAHLHAQPATRRQALGWHQSGTTYDQLWQPPVIFQQAGPPGGYYSYIPPHLSMVTAYEQPPFGRPSPYNRYVPQVEQQRTNGAKTQQTTRDPRPDPVIAPMTQTTVEPISFEGDSVVVVDDFDFLIERVMQVKGKKKRRGGTQRREEERRQSFSTDLGTCSRSQSSASTADIPRDSIPNGKSRHARLPLHDWPPYSKYVQRTARAAGGGNPYARQSHRSGDSQGRKGEDDVRSKSRWRRRQAGNCFPCHCTLFSYFVLGVSGSG